jgi:hypothetical protein
MRNEQCGCEECHLYIYCDDDVCQQISMGQDRLDFNSKTNIHIIARGWNCKTNPSNATNTVHGDLHPAILSDAFPLTPDSLDDTKSLTAYCLIPISMVRRAMYPKDLKSSLLLPPSSWLLSPQLEDIYQSDSKPQFKKHAKINTHTNFHSYSCCTTACQGSVDGVAYGFEEGSGRLCGKTLWNGTTVFKPQTQEDI